MTRNQLTKLENNLGDLIVSSNRIGDKITITFKSGFSIQYTKGEEERIEWLVDKLANKILN